MLSDVVNTKNRIKEKEREREQEREGEIEIVRETESASHAVRSLSSI
jgi:hypothetical protein